jgi:hypothetical protein
MIKNHVIMSVNALILIVAGVYGYFTSGSATALIAPGIGIILLAMVYPVMKENRTVAHIGVILTLIASITFIIVGIRRANPMVIGMGVITFLCFDLYILNFILRKKKNQADKTV